MDDLHEDPKTRESNQNEMTKVTEDFPSDTKPQVASGSELTSSQVNMQIDLFQLTYLNAIHETNSYFSVRFS